MKQQGFTLIEIMIALVVFAILATITASSMYHAFDTRKRIAQITNELSQIELVEALMRQDSTQTIARTTFGNEMHVFSAFIGSNRYIEFTRDGHVNPGALELRSTLTRVAYLCKGQTLIRRYWEQIDTPNRHAHHDKVLLTHLNKCSFAYINSDQQVLPEWQPDLSNDRGKRPIPHAWQVNLTLHQHDPINLLFIFPVALYGS